MSRRFIIEAITLDFQILLELVKSLVWWWMGGGVESTFVFIFDPNLKNRILAWLGQSWTKQNFSRYWHLANILISNVTGGSNTEMPAQIVSFILYILISRGSLTIKKTKLKWYSVQLENFIFIKSILFGLFDYFSIPPSSNETTSGSTGFWL